MMKAVHIINPGKNSTLEIGEAPRPEPGTGEILVKVEATALNRADLLQRAGKYPPPEGVTGIPGLEMAGIVEKAGPQAERWSPGDFVFGLLPGGGYAEYCVLPEQMALPIPDSMSFEEAAAIPETFLTAYQALKWVGELGEGERVLIHAGGSGVGTSAIQLARHLFHATIATTAGKQHKLDTCLELGADHAINYKEQDFAEEITRALGKEAIDLVVDFIGAPYWQQNIDVLATDGRLVYLSFLGGHRLEQMSLAPILRKRLTVRGSTLRSRPVPYKARLTREFAEEALPLFEQEVIRPVIDSRFDWSEAEAAHERMQNDQNTGKIVLTGM